MTAFITGVFVGAFAGVILMSILALSRDDDDDTQ